MKKTKEAEEIKNKMGTTFLQGYGGFRDKNTQMTPRQLLDYRKAQLAEMELAQKKGELVPYSEVEAGLKEAAEVIQSDLYGTLISRCVGEFANQKLSPQEVRERIKRIIDEIVKSWSEAELIK